MKTKLYGVQLAKKIIQVIKDVLTHGLDLTILKDKRKEASHGREADKVSGSY